MRISVSVSVSLRFILLHSFNRFAREVCFFFYFFSFLARDNKTNSLYCTYVMNGIYRDHYMYTDIFINNVCA